MHFVVMGSGRVGSMVAAALDAQRHSVAVIDTDSNAFRKLPEDFDGHTIKGVGFDRAVLKKAGIEDAYGFAAVSNDDNSNILGARVARETFGVDHVVARILDPHRADVYQRLGIPTTGTVKWSASMIIHQMMPDSAQVAYSDPEHPADIMRIRPVNSWIGISIHDIETHFGVSVAYIVRLGRPIFDVHRTVVQENDELFIASPREVTPSLRHALTRMPNLEE